ncbi:hypothetical protein JCGZ_15831 [Jatropha curcas]|uniref:Protein kinase domain-containing protein n=1 Tax=Jatropha curcas TaxID=180498 RepID=A0A067LBD2_JATCU|nr:wall-associated receptor kinase-like 8 [Jatropha curcas]KDP41424.1 hypothetical protein JCGZ_15831 [Jatropha curcas]
MIVQPVEKIHIISMLILCLAQALSLPLEPCQYNCGNVSFEFPFGIGKDCYLNESFEVTCNYSFDPPKAFLTSINMELLDGTYKSGQVQVNNPIIYSDCSDKAFNRSRVSISGSPFVFSNDSNRFTARGCDNYAMLVQDFGNTVGGCLSICPSGANTSGCYGINCCQATIPPYIQSFEVTMTNPFGIREDKSSCKSAFIVDQDWFASRHLDDLNRLENVPAALDWATYLGFCDISRESNIVCTYDSSYCWKELKKNRVCICDGCQDIGRCTDPRDYRCRLYCIYTPGSYHCSCPYGYKSFGYWYKSFGYGMRCYPPYFWSGKRSRAKFIIIGCASGLGLLLFLISLWLLYKLIKRRKAMKLRQKFFKRNGGLLLQQQLFSTETNVEQTKLFTSKELEKATDYYHVNRILGHGGQGTVYKGMLTDGRVVAIKKSTVVDEDKLDQFINEVVILSQVNHRNVVKLIGCCLETEVPLLVYEFIPNGTLFQYIHNQNEEFPITWEMRLRIATEVAGALSYLHSAASIPIYHRDIKSSNILLDEKYGAKVADFGTSRSISIDQTHVTTRVQGTFGYLDPEYFQSSQFTEKSDVYSFGVVLVELLTGQKPISAVRSGEERSLATYFLLAMEENHLFEILDARLAEEGEKKDIIATAKLAEGCLNLNGKKRPTMKTVAMVLEGIRASLGASTNVNEQDYEEVDYSLGDHTGPWDVPSSTSTESLKGIMRTRLDQQPLLSN